MTNTLGALLKKDWDERLEDDKLIIERILILIRNVLQVPTNVRREGRMEDDATVHDQILWVLHKSGMQDLLLYISSSDMEQQYSLHVLEIISLMFREQDPMSLASANLGRSKAEKEADEEALSKARRLEEQKEQAKVKAKMYMRHSRFGGTFTVKNVKSITDRDLIVQKPLSSINDINFDKKKRGVKRAKNRVAPDNLDTVRRSTLPVRLFLKEFCIEFLHSSYNHLMNIVKDALNRQKAQMNDETYYLWAMRFFMMFNRGHELKLELVSETLSRQTFHFLQQQMDNYRDNFEHEKKNRPKYLMWGRRMHLCIRAYQELLYNLVDMEASSNPDIKEAGRVLKASVFYEPEYRELCLQQLSSYNPDRMSKDYLTDLVSTTHVFLKLMEHMSKNKHLIVSKKTKRKVKKSSNKSGQEVGVGGDAAIRENNEQRWEAISSRLSAILQGRGEELPTDIMPFDAASDVSMEDQKVAAMRNIQKSLRNKDPASAVALMRAAREVWPDGDNFGEAGAEPEEEFMALREVLFAELDVEEEAEAVPTESGEVGEEINEEDDEEEEEQERVVSVEQEFNYKAFVFRFAVKNVAMPYGVLFNNYLKNTKDTNHHIVKMFHRIAVDCELPALLFQASIFRVFQQIWRDLKTNPKDPSLRELAKFAKFIVSKFLAVASTNKKVFIELLFWKTSREATEIVEGYGTQTNSNKAKASFWSSEEEERLTTVFGQVMEMEKSGENTDKDGDVLDQIELMFSCENRSRRQIGNKLRELGLIQNMREITKKSLKSSRSWQDDEIDKLKELFEEFKTAENPGARIHEQWKAANMPVRSKNKLCEKIVELGWVEDRSKLGKVRKRNRRPKEGEAGFLNSKSDTDSALDSSSSDNEESGSEEEVVSSSSPSLSVKEALQRLDFEESKTLKWLSETLLEESQDRGEDFDGEDVPLVTVDEEIQSALCKQTVKDAFSSLGLCAPVQGEQFWRVPGDLTVLNLEVRADLLKKVSEGEDIESVFENVDMSQLASVRGFEAMKTVKTKKKKEKRNKWLPFRRPDEETPTVSTPAAKSSTQSKKSKNKSFLESSDEENDPDNNLVENDENADPKDKENLPSPVMKTKAKEKEKDKESPKKPAVNPLDRVKKLDMSKLKKLLNDDSFTGSDESDEENDKDDVEAKNSSDEENMKKNKKAPAKKKQAQKKPAAKRGKAKSSKEEEEINSSDDEDDKPKKKSKPKKKPPPKKKGKKGEVVNSSDDEDNEAKPKRKTPPKKKGKKVVESSSSDEGVVDPTQPSNERIRAESSADDTMDKAPVRKRSNTLDSSSDEGVEDPTQPSGDRIKAATSEDDPEVSRPSSGTKRPTVVDSSEEEEIALVKKADNKKVLDSDSDNDSRRSPSMDSRINDSRLDDSSAKSPTQYVYSPRNGSLNDSRISRKSSFDDSRLSRRSSFDDSRSKSPTQWVYTPKKGSQNDTRKSRSPISSPLSSRSISPLTPASKSSIMSPVVKSTPAGKRLRSDTQTPQSTEKNAKKSRISSPNKSLNLQLSDSSDMHDESPVKKPSKKKAFIESDSE